MVNDPIADMITRIRNGAMASKEYVDIPASKMKLSIADIFLREGYIKGYRVLEDSKQGILRITLKYFNSRHVMSGVERVSKPGRRIYKKVSEIPKVRNGLGVIILSTSKGLMTDHKARKENIGGELLIKVW
ncbi:MAG: 30S ribosomal protein S8 [Deltaproteobacteria bacterium]|nr:30S ribosomal protein S8 [Deltaproteobacteria bacterium]